MKRRSGDSMAGCRSPSCSDGTRGAGGRRCLGGWSLNTAATSGSPEANWSGDFVRTKLRKLDDSSVQDKTFRAGEKFRPVRTETRRMQYLYDSGDAGVFMDNSSYEQLELPRAVAGEAMRWVTPNSEVEVLFV